jgi:hypothetical protein
MTGKTYLNQITASEVSLGIERLLIAPKDTTWSVARIDINTPPSNFVDLGSVVEDTPVLKVTREKFKLITGIPRVLQYQAILAMEGTFQAMLHSKDWSKLQYAMGNTSPDTTNWATTPGSSQYIIQYYGTRKIKEFVILGVVDFIDGTQVIHHLPRATPADEIEENYRPDQEGRVPIKMELLSKTMTVEGASELVLALRYQFGPDGTGV